MKKNFLKSSLKVKHLFIFDYIFGALKKFFYTPFSLKMNINMHILSLVFIYLCTFGEINSKKICQPRLIDIYKYNVQLCLNF